MARGRRSAGPEVSLFPFLSILACLIGALTMLIVAMSLMEIVQGREDESVARAEDFVALESALAQREREVLRLEEDLERTNAAAASLAKVRPKVDRLRVEVEKLEKTAAPRASLQEELAALEERMKALQDEQEAVDVDLVRGREQMGEMAKQLGKGDPLRILPALNFFRKVSPTFVEVRADEVIVHTASRSVGIKRGALANSKDYAKVIEFVKKEEDRVIVFLIRENGRVTYNAARSVARQRGAVTSKLPLLGEGDIDLRQFFRKG